MNQQNQARNLRIANGLLIFTVLLLLAVTVWAFYAYQQSGVFNGLLVVVATLALVVALVARASVTGKAAKRE